MLNETIVNLPRPPIPEIAGWAAAYRGNHGDLIDLSQAVPGFEPHPDLLRSLAAKAGSAAMAKYGSIEGEIALRRALADHVSSLYTAGITPEEIHVTAGCNQAFCAAALAVAGPGHSILTTNPFYFNHDSILRMLGIGTRQLALDPDGGFLPDPAKLADAIAPDVRAVAIVTPNNPTGAICPPSLLDALFDVCSERGIWLILDETYRDFLPHGAGAPHDLFARPDWPETLIQLYSFSKSFCIPGHRLGAITAGPRVIEAIAKIMDNLQICAPRAPQAAIAENIAGLAGWRRANASEIARRVEAFSDAIGHAAGWEIASIGAYFAYVRHPYEASSSRVAGHLARDVGLVSLPGSVFGPGQERYLRMAVANVDVPAIREIPVRLRLMPKELRYPA